MKLYKRNNHLKLLLFRLTLVVIITINIFLIKNDLSDYSYVLFILLSVGAVFPITDLSIDDKMIMIKQYFIYGFIPRKTIFERDDDVSINDFEIEMNNAATWADLDTDALTRPLIEKKYVFGEIRQAKLKLSNKEFLLIKKYFIDKETTNVLPEL